MPSAGKLDCTDYRMPPKSCRTWDSSECAETGLLVE